MNLAAHIGEQVKSVNRNPSDGQKRAGNYRKGHVRVHGLDISIENPRGSYRHGVGENGKPWRSRLPHHYGYFRGTEGSDGDHVDVFLGPHLRSGAVYIIDQKDLRTGDHDEHKVMLGFGSEKQAREAYKQAFSDGKGAQRISSIEGMTIERLREWLKGKAVRRADGGRVGYAEGGPPAFEETSALPSFDQTEPVPGHMEALGRGALKGATYGFGDEMAGFHEAGPKMAPPIGPIPPAAVRAGIGAARVGYDALTGRDPEATKTYETERDRMRSAEEAAKKAHPYTFTGGELAGAVPAIAAAPEAGAVRALAPAAGRGAKFVAGAIDSATQGGIYGGLSGAGEGKDIGERAMEGAKGIVSGIIGGGIAHTGSKIAEAAYDKFGAPIVNAIRGYMNPNGEAARRLATALKIDQDLIQQGKASGMTPQQWAAARRNGEPVTLADLGSARTQSLLRSAANTSPEARAQLEKTFEDRFLAQSERVGDTVRSALPGGTANARKTSDQIVAEYDAGRAPLYRKAYEDGDREIISPVIERLMGSPTFEAAMKGAISGGKDAAISMEGRGAFNPGIRLDPGGAFVYTKSKPGGGPVYPNLQYWDAVKQQLDDVAQKAKQSGEFRKADVVGNMARLLRRELDAQVPSYKNARGIAEEFFGERNALEAGRALAGKKPVAAEVEAILRKMKPDERELFREGYASDLAERVIDKMKDTQNITKSMFNSPNERKLAAVVFGPGGMAQLQARMALETIMNGARDALGNSTTARQLIEAGLAGGAIEGYLTGDWKTAILHGGAGAIGGGLAGKVAGEQIAKSAGKLIGKVDGKTARRVAELLTSNDPRLLREGYRLAAGNQKIRDALMSIANRVALSGQAQAREPVSGAMKMLQGPMSGRAEDEQQRP